MKGLNNLVLGLLPVKQDGQSAISVVVGAGVALIIWAVFQPIFAMFYSNLVVPYVVNYSNSEFYLLLYQMTTLLILVAIIVGIFAQLQSGQQQVYVR